MSTLRHAIDAAFATFLMTLREIFDENAYERFLVRTGASRSRASYQAFLDDLRRRDATRIRCC